MRRYESEAHGIRHLRRNRPERQLLLNLASCFASVLSRLARAFSGRIHH